MTDLEIKIIEAQDAYYNSEPIMSDEEFDALWNKLQEEQPDSSLFDAVGKDDSDSFSKEEHIMNMSSQEKVNDEKSFSAWWNKRVDSGAIVQYKMDGISIELQYNKGTLQKAITRGNGKIGDNITNNVLKMKGFPINITLSCRLAVRGEIILERGIFEKKYLPQGYANPRNMASGLAKQKEGKGCEDLSIYFYDLLAENHEKNIGTKESDKIAFLEKEGFTQVPTFLAKVPEDVFEVRNELKNTSREELNYDIDGIVIKNDKYNLEDLQRPRPQYQIAFKFDTVSAATKIKGIYWSVSGRIITPVALLEPVKLEGAIVRKASLANPNRMRELSLRFNDIVLVSRRGQIIPYIENVISSDTKNEKIPCYLKSYKDKKGVEWPVKDEGTRLIIDDKSFPEIRLHRIKKWINKLGVKGFGDALLNKLFEENWVNDISDLYMLNLEAYLSSTNLKKATQKAFDNLYKIKEVPLSVFVGGFDIEDVGEKIISLAVKNGYDTLKKLEEASITNLSEIDGIGEYRAARIEEGLVELKSEMFKVLNFVKIKEKEAKMNTNISGKTFCFTGALESMKRAEAQALVEEMGGSSKSSVSKDLDFLVNNDINSTSSKNKKANDYGVTIINEQQFLEMIEK